jgi:hypothetical protein
VTSDDTPATGLQQGVSEIVCAECETSPRLKSLDKNDGTQLMCNCDDVGKSMDAVPYELRVADLPGDWIVMDGRTPRDLAREVNCLMDAGHYECPSCGSEFGITEGNVSCRDCGYIPPEARA